MLKLNLGCGAQVVDGWVNVDYALGARLASTPWLGAAVRKLGLFRMEWDRRIHIHDLTKPLPWAEGSVDACYSSHTLEHLAREDGHRLAREVFRVLKPGGVLRVVVPDLRAIVQRYVAGELRADRMLEELGTLYGTDKEGWRRRLSPLVEVPHRCMYDTPTMIQLLTSVGFDAESRAAFESSISEIAAIEIPSRTLAAVIVEGKKPSRV